MTKALGDETQKAVHAPPAYHQLEPQGGGPLDNPANSHVRLQDSDMRIWEARIPGF